MQELTRSSQALQSMVMQVRMIPVDVVFLRFPRLVRDLSGKLGKEVKLNLVGSETELDRTVVDALGDPLVHLVRNSLDHGLEGVEARVAAGKPEVGTLEISARHAGGSVVIEVRDDGRGINPRGRPRKAVERGLIDAAAAAEITPRRAVELLFAPGFSTAETTSDISGRGVGMDAVRTKIRELGGEVILDSVQGEGTTAQIRLPLTLAIVSALHVDVAGGPRTRSRWTASSARCAWPSSRSARWPARGCWCSTTACSSCWTAPTCFGVSLRRARPTLRGHRAQRRAPGAVGRRSDRPARARHAPAAAAASGEPVSGGAALADGRIALIVDCDALDARTPKAESRDRGARASETSTVTGNGRVAA